MRYRILKEGLEILDKSQFNIRHILECGQIFRYSLEKDCCKIVAKNLFSRLYSYDDRDIIISDNAIEAEKYFDLARDYTLIKEHLKGRHTLLDAATDFGYGIRILYQDPVEMIISFIISANNNIPRIKGIIERLCRELGKESGGYYAFPTLGEMSSADEAFYKSIGAGYRARYLTETVKRLKNDFDVNLYGIPSDEARKRLMTLLGVGGKVADCILLFGYHKTDVFPMDTWSKKIYFDFGFPDAPAKDMAKRLVDMFGDMSGYAQQYLYYYYRENQR